MIACRLGGLIRDFESAIFVKRLFMQLSDHFTIKKLIHFTVPSIAMMVFTSIYGVVDGLFLSNFAGKMAFTSLNFIMPVVMILSAVGFLFGTGGCALISKYMGEGRQEHAESLFTQNAVTSFFCGLVLAVLGLIFMPKIAALLGAEGELLKQSVLYGRILMISLPFYIMQTEFQTLFPAAEKPKLGLYVTVTAGVCNMILDGLFCGVFGWGLVGAAAATVICEYIGGLLPIIYFASPKNTSRLRFRKFSYDVKALIKVLTNGSSELMSNISMSLVGMLFNVQLLKYAGSDGVAAYGVIMYVNFIFVAIFIGYSVGAAPLMSYNFGAGNKAEMKGILHKSLCIIGCVAVAMFVIAHIFGGTIASIFVGYDAELLATTTHAFSIYSYAFLLSGFSIYASSFFTALNDGLTSALISFLRTLLFEVACLLVLPLIWGVDGIWDSVIAAEVMSVIVAAIFMVAKRKKYGY